MRKTRLFSAVVVFLAAAGFVQAQYATLHHFLGGATDGATPNGSLIRKGAALYGMTPRGGTSNEGTIFKINANGTGFTLLHSFAGAEDGRRPWGSLTYFGGKLYGLTSAGGTADGGVIFRMNPDGTGFTVLHSFAGGAADGLQPFGSLTIRGGTLYGMTCGGGADGYGVIFKIKANGTGFALLHAFSGGASDGSSPYGSLLYSGNKLYGMTSAGGADNLGTIFQIGSKGTGFGLLHSFAGGDADGSLPWHGKLVAKGTLLFGTTRSGGIHTRGVLFRINKNGEGYAVLHQFAYNTVNGAYCYGSLIFRGTKLYGLTLSGGAAFDGTIFRIDPDGTDFEIVHSFDRSAGEGADPCGDLISVGKTLYGMTWHGGTSDIGTVFSHVLQ